MGLTRRVPSTANQNAGCAPGGGGSGQVFEGGASQTGQHAEESEEPDGHTQQSEKVDKKNQSLDMQWGPREGMLEYKS